MNIVLLYASMSMFHNIHYTHGSKYDFVFFSPPSGDFISTAAIIYPPPGGFWYDAFPPPADLYHP